MLPPLRRPALAALALLLAAPLAARQTPAPTERVYVDAGRAERVEYSGAAYTRRRDYLEGGGVGNGLYAADQLLAGDFRVELRLTLLERNSSAAAVQLGESYFGLDGAGERLYLNGPLFGGRVSLLGDAGEFLSAGEEFELVAARSGASLRVTIDGALALERPIGAGVIGRFGLLPHRATMRVRRFAASGALGQPPARDSAELHALQPGIDAAIDAGVAFLLDNQHRDGSWSDNALKFEGGMTALAAYTLLKCGLAPEHPAVAQALSYLEEVVPHETYSVGFHLLALAATGDARQLERIEALCDVLLAWQQDGSWGYPWAYSDGWLESVDRSDLSNAQIAALGLRAASAAGAHVPRKAWQDLITSTLALQTPEERILLPADVGTTRTTPLAGFGYKTPSSPTGSMTAAGVANLAIARAALGGALRGRPAREVDAAIRAGEQWMAQHFAVDANPGRGDWLYYWLYGLERVGALLETEELGAHLWYLEGAEAIVRAQDADGSWSERLREPDTAFALLFLKRATATPTSGGRRRSAGVHVAQDKDLDVHLRATGENPLDVWLTGFGELAQIYYGQDDAGPRVRAVEYLVDGELAARVEADPSFGWEGERYPARLEFEQRGSYTISARVEVLVPGEERGLSPELDVLHCAGFVLEVEQATEAWMQSAARLRARNGMLANIASVAASSQWGQAWTPASACDGQDSTAWLAGADDAQPSLRFELARPVRAERLVLGQAGSSATRARELDRLQRVEVIVNGEEPIVVELDPDPRRPHELDLGRRRRVRTLELRILESTPGARYPGARGFSEVALLARARRQ